MPPVVALLTDFGQQDVYVGAMKGAILSVCPEATIVDVLHEVPAHDVVAGALALESTYGIFPARTVFVAVVDPGVGSERRGLALAAAGRVFVGPDNGIFSAVLAERPEARVHVITNQSLFRQPVSPVFHGRDVFGPVAAHIARGRDLAEVGPEIRDPALLALPTPRRRDEHEWEGDVVHVDRFGNLTTSLRVRELETLERVGAGPIRVAVEGRPVPLVRSYADIPEGQPCALVGSGGRLEIAVHKGSAARVLEAAAGTRVRLSRGG